MKITTPSGLKIYFTEVFPNEIISEAIITALADKQVEITEERRARVKQYEPVLEYGKMSYWMAHQIEINNQTAN